MNNITVTTEFLRELYTLPREIQKDLFDTLDQLSVGTTNGMNVEKMYNTDTGKTIHSIRVNQKYRFLVHIENNTWILLRIATHEKAYDSVQKLDVLHFLKLEQIKVDTAPCKPLHNLFAGISNKRIVELGIPESEIPIIRKIKTEAEYNKMKENNIFPKTVFDNLDLILAEYSFNDVIIDYNNRYKKACELLINNVIEPALKCKTLDEHIKESVVHTKDRIFKKGNLQEILDFYYDALIAKSGISICEELHKNGLKAFEDYKDDILKISRGY